MRKLCALLLTCALVLSLAACSNNDGVSDESTSYDLGTADGPADETTTAASAESTTALNTDGAAESEADTTTSATDASGDAIDETTSTATPPEITTEATTEAATESKPSTGLSGGTAEVLDKLITAAGTKLDEDNALPMAFTDPVSGDNSKNATGLDTDQFNKYVAEATVSTGAMMTMPHQIAVIKCKDEAAAKEVKALVASGFDSNKWICVIPDKSAVTASGEYVLLVVGRNEASAAVLSAFADLTGVSADKANVFFTKT
ncbi:MAG: DUF4358 domain-containing protein [Oscillospiraceae bacterium]|jgi:hypothetical protein|nr:DUF4358 domain-containing protein [Oscillospiraceae bacterium]